MIMNSKKGWDDLQFNSYPETNVKMNYPINHEEMHVSLVLSVEYCISFC